ncbi:MAG TPA: alpha-L-fucosidase [Armatimonadota bacterium]|nr:alpha-L-fucosidase [Armatimonadota bacterium]
MNPVTPTCAALLMAAMAADAADAPAPYGPLPSRRQLAWHQLEFYGFLHFTVNTFTDKEWGFGDEPESVFSPTDFDADQIVGAAKEAGMAGLILTAKHHDGFCLWPSRYTNHSVKHSPWKGGRGDVVGEISDACRRHGLRFGVYLSPWDRNHAAYGREQYVEYYRKQLRELLTEYGPIFEVWFDGANGGDGYYGGARETRHVDKLTYYDWPTTWGIVRELQPDAMIFSDVGPDVRWVGNESGIAGEPCWATITPEGTVGDIDPARNTSGVRDGTHWLPAEADVSIRPGWFYHASEDDRVKTPQQLLDLYFASVGRGASLLLNLPPDRRGRIHENDVEALRGFRRLLGAILSVDLARHGVASATHQRGHGDRFSPSRAIDGDPETYWSTDDGVTTPELTVELKQPARIATVRLREYLPLGQRVDGFAIDARAAGEWHEVAAAQAIGPHRLLRFEPVEADAVRLRITAAPVCPAIAEFAVFPEARG